MNTWKVAKQYFIFSLYFMAIFYTFFIGMFILMQENNLPEGSNAWGVLFFFLFLIFLTYTFLRVPLSLAIDESELVVKDALSVTRIKYEDVLSVKKPFGTMGDYVYLKTTRRQFSLPLFCIEGFADFIAEIKKKNPQIELKGEAWFDDNELIGLQILMYKWVFPFFILVFGFSFFNMAVLVKMNISEVFKICFVVSSILSLVTAVAIVVINFTTKKA